MDEARVHPPVRMTPRSQETPPENRALLDAMERRANEARYTPNTDDADWPIVLAEVQRCAAHWEPEARLLGNVRAGDIVRALGTVAQLNLAHLTLPPDPGAGQAVPGGWRPAGEGEESVYRSQYREILEHFKRNPEPTKRPSPPAPAQEAESGEVDETTHCTECDKRVRDACNSSFCGFADSWKARCRQLEAEVAALADPIAVHRNMLAGRIAKPEFRPMLHVYGADALETWDRAAASRAVADDLARALEKLDAWCSWSDDNRHRDIDSAPRRIISAALAAYRNSTGGA